MTFASAVEVGKMINLEIYSFQAFLIADNHVFE
ncbi:hypothetical protein CQR44_1193 [Bifidobacterium asteroides]|uniref:Uncharacterized protein n=1 Tax=Bifidobacterium asteroides TaxID=1684 RepID=A0A2N3RAY2_9BIFI|nr:hypothetical protein CQR44_1193 [Bifidobacterium asteroides]